MAIQQLLEQMELLDGLHQELLDLADRKKQVLIRNDIEALNRIVHRENQLTKQVVEYEAKRQEEADKFLIARGFRPHPNVTVSDLIKLAFKADDKKALGDAQERLMRTLKRLKEANALNQKLLQQSIVFVNYTLDLIAGAPDEDVIYTNPTAQAPAMKRPGMFDTRA